ncbi:MAG: thiamine diphosphokinase [Clostridiaceae bacterium]|nr:thiamine diphosphokinase [Clostridiaceae bacterium]
MPACEEAYTYFAAPPSAEIRHRGCVLLSLNGSCEINSFTKHLIASATRIIAVDGGWSHLKDLGCRPDLLVGDLDSLPEEASADPLLNGVARQLYDRDKDKTDTELALNLAVREGANAVVLLGAMSAERPDHTLATLYLAMDKAGKGVRTLLTDGRSVLIPLVGPDRCRIDLTGFRASLAGTDRNLYVSLLPLTREVCGVTTENLRWSLIDSRLAQNEARGISNEPVPGNDFFTISFATGNLLVCLTSEN